jgi:uncharacterized sulfatase
MTLYDLGTKVPLAMRWPEKIKGGRVVDDLVTLADLAPTFLDVAGLEVPPAMTARSLVSVLLTEQSGQIDAERDKAFASIELHCGRYPMRSVRTPEFLYIRNFEPERPINLCSDYWESEAGYSPTWLAVKALASDSAMFHRVAGPRPEEELYDVRADPYQLENLAGDSGYAELLATLSTMLEEELTRTGDPRIEGRHEEVFYEPHYQNVESRKQ